MEWLSKLVKGTKADEAASVSASTTSPLRSGAAA